MNLVEIYMESPEDTDKLFKEEVDDYQRKFHVSRRRAYREIEELYEDYYKPYSPEEVLVDRGY